MKWLRIIVCLVVITLLGAIVWSVAYPMLFDRDPEFPSVGIGKSS